MAEPNRIEAALARRLRTLSIPAEARGQVNSFASQPDRWRQN